MSFEIAKAHIVAAAGGAEPKPPRRRRLDARAERHAGVADLVVRILAAADAEFAGDALDRPLSKGALELHARLALAAPRQRHGDAAARAEAIDEADAGAVGEAVAVFRMQDRHEHAAAPELLHRARREIERIDAGHFVDDDHQQDVVGVLDRSKPLAHLDAVEAAALFELVLYLFDQLIGGRLADDVADDAEDVGIRRGVIAVHAHFTDDARRGLRERELAQPSASTTIVERT